MADRERPSSRSGAVQILEGSLSDVSDMIGADFFSLDGRQVSFVRKARFGQPEYRWVGQLGDWLVAEGSSSWRLVPDTDIGT